MPETHTTDYQGQSDLATFSSASNAASSSKIPSGREKFQEIIFSLSLANLCLWEAWIRAPRRSDSYFSEGPASWSFIAVVLCDLSSLTAIFWSTARLIRSSRNSFLRWSAKRGFLLLLIVPLTTAVAHSGISLTHVQKAWGFLGIVLVDTILALLVGFIVIKWGEALVRPAKAAVLILAPLLPLVFLRAGWSILQAPPASAYVDQRTAPLFPSPSKSAPRVVWLLFDELDQYIAFDRRPDKLDLPELDHLVSESLYATRAFPPAGETIESIPAMITGRLVRKSEPHGPNDLMLTFSDSNEKGLWSHQATVFSRAQQAGWNTAVAGWFHPYCRVMGRDLMSCGWQSYMDATDTLRHYEYDRRLGFAGKMFTQAQGQLDLLAAVYLPYERPLFRRELQSVRAQQESAYLQIHDQALRLVNDTRFSLVLVHWPIPHPLGIFHRYQQELTSQSDSDYVDNLALVDRTLGELRRTMEVSGMWDKSIVIVSADHPLRAKMWSLYPQYWTQEEAAITGNREHRRVPFILKMQGQNKHIAYESSFNNVLTHDLILSLLRGEVSTPDAVVHWLDQNRSRVAAPAIPSDQK